MLSSILLISFALVVDARVVNIVPSNGPTRAVCSTPECKEFANEIKLNMNSSVDPCTDFYEYACGNWPQRNPLPPGKNVWKVLMIAEQENKRKVEDLLRTPPQPDEIPPVRTVKAWYRACIDTESMEQRNMQPIVSILSDIGNWPIITGKEKWNETRCKWQIVDDYYARLRAVNWFHEVRVATYGKNATGLSVVLDLPDLPPATWLLNTEIDEANADFATESSKADIPGDNKKIKKDGKYWQFVSKIILAVAEAANQNLSRDRLNREIEELLNFQWKLGQLTYDYGDYVNMTIGEFQQWYNDMQPLTANARVNWTEKIISLFKDAKVHVDVNTNMKVVAPEYFRKLIPLLDSTPSRTIVNYVHWSFVSSMITKTTKEMRNLYDRTTSDDENPDEPSRSEQCIEEAQMNDIIAFEYIRRYFSNETLRMVLDAMDDMEKEIELQINASNWANTQIKNWALRKLRTIKRHVGYPSWYNNETIMNSYFQGLNVGSEYFENSLNLQKYYTIKKLKTLQEEDNIKRWIIDPLTINAFYLNEDNSITIPAANLQKPFFTYTQPNTVNYALTGFLLAHEMNHGFDTQRRIYNEHGQKFTWPTDMEEDYDSSIKCFIEQTDNFTLDGKPDGPKIKGYGNQTIEETMSDTMGLQASLKAYQRRERINGALEPALFGLDEFTNDQLFFLSFANLWCEVIDPEYLPILPMFDMHGTGRMRAISSLSNNPEFAKAFDCPLGSPMNPKRKCNTWDMPDRSTDQASEIQQNHYRAYRV